LMDWSVCLNGDSPVMWSAVNLQSTKADEEPTSLASNQVYASMRSDVTDRKTTRVTHASKSFSRRCGRVNSRWSSRTSRLLTRPIWAGAVVNLYTDTYRGLVSGNVVKGGTCKRPPSSSNW
jgi:hypothetical protein